MKNKISKGKKTIVLCLLSIVAHCAYARECKLADEWKCLCPILEERTQQSVPKMKLKENTALEFEHFLKIQTLKLSTLNQLQKILPKTTVEILMAIRFRGMCPQEAESIAQYLIDMTKTYRFKNVKAFDNNTSHIIGREWHEIDYTGEGMHWKTQKAKYASYGITNFKTLDNIKKFFPVESKLPYFRKIYQCTMEIYSFIQLSCLVCFRI